MKTNLMKITASKTKVFRLKRVFPPVLFLDSCHVVVVCVCFCVSSPHRAEVLCTHRVHALMLAFFTKIFFARRALFDGATPTSPVIRPTGPDKWVSPVLAVAGVQSSGHGQAVRLGAFGRGSEALDG